MFYEQPNAVGGVGDGAAIAENANDIIEGTREALPIVGKALTLATRVAGAVLTAGAYVVYARHENREATDILRWFVTEYPDALFLSFLFFISFVIIVGLFMYKFCIPICLPQTKKGYIILLVAGIIFCISGMAVAYGWVRWAASKLGPPQPIFGRGVGGDEIRQPNPRLLQ